MVTMVAADILGAAIDCLADGPLRVDEVARRAGCNKRMIYHYYHNKAGLVSAARAAQADLLAGSRLVSADTRGVLRRLFPERDAVATTASFGRLQRAARILLLALLEEDQEARLAALPPAIWQQFALELTTLALRGKPLDITQQLDPVESEDSLTATPSAQEARAQPKPSYRLSSVSRPRTD